MRDLRAEAEIFDSVTALGLICRVPTLSLGSVTAAYDVPPSAMNSASNASTFATRGPAGPTGPAGPPGVKGATGMTGARGPVNVVMRIGTATAVAANASATASADCNAGEMATGGGFFTQADVQVTASRPVPLTAGAQATGWQATVKNTTGSTAFVGAYAMCTPIP